MVTVAWDFHAPVDIVCRPAQRGICVNCDVSVIQQRSQDGITCIQQSRLIRGVGAAEDCLSLRRILVGESVALLIFGLALPDVGNEGEDTYKNKQYR